MWEVEDQERSPPDYSISCREIRRFRGATGTYMKTSYVAVLKHRGLVNSRSYITRGEVVCGKKQNIEIHRETII